MMQHKPPAGSPRSPAHAVGRPWRWMAWAALLCLLPAWTGGSDAELPERIELEWMLDSGGDALEGIVFDVREYDSDALNWLLPRLSTYLKIIHAARPGLPVALVSHGEEMALLTRAAADAHPGLHTRLRRLVQEGLTIHVCGTFAAERGLDPSDFPPYVDFVPYGPAQVEDYKRLGYGHISLELTW